MASPSLRILHINDYRSAGGAEVIVERLIELQRQRGHDVSLFTIDDVPGHKRTAINYLYNHPAQRALRARLRDLAPDVIHLHNWYHELSPAVLIELATWRDKRRAARLRDHHAESHGDVRTAPPPPRIVMTAHDHHLLCPNPGRCHFRDGDQWTPADPHRLDSLTYLLARRWDHRGLAHSWLKLIQHLYHYRLRRRHRVIDLIISPSRYLGDLFKARGLPVEVIYHPVSATRTSRDGVLSDPPPLREGLGEGEKPPRHSPATKTTIDAPSASDHQQSTIGNRKSAITNPPTLVFAGRIAPEKGLAEFLKNVPADFAARFTVIGDGPDLSRCKSICERRGLGDVVNFTGRLPRDETLRRIAAAHVLVLPSRLPEVAPLSLFEALAAGVNILTTDLGGGAEVVADAGVGYTYPPHDPEALRATLAAIARDFQAGTLNQFDVSDLIAARDESTWVDRVLAAYDRGRSRP